MKIYVVERIEEICTVYCGTIIKVTSNEEEIAVYLESDNYDVTVWDV